jgi:hypothetical protein
MIKSNQKNIWLKTKAKRLRYLEIFWAALLNLKQLFFNKCLRFKFKLYFIIQNKYTFIIQIIIKEMVSREFETMSSV